MFLYFHSIAKYCLFYGLLLQIVCVRQNVSRRSVPSGCGQASFPEWVPTD